MPPRGNERRHPARGVGRGCSHGSSAPLLLKFCAAIAVANHLLVPGAHGAGSARGGGGAFCGPASTIHLGIAAGPFASPACRMQQGPLLRSGRLPMLPGAAQRLILPAGMPSSSSSSLSSAGARVGGGLMSAMLSGKPSGGDSIKSQQLRTRLKTLKVAELRDLLGQFGTAENPKLKKSVHAPPHVPTSSPLTQRVPALPAGPK